MFMLESQKLDYLVLKYTFNLKSRILDADWCRFARHVTGSDRESES